MKRTERENMRANRQGIQIGKPAIKALLAFAGDDERTNVVHFRVPEPGAKLFASVTDGKRACEAIAETEDPQCVSGEWAVDRAFLAACCRALEGDQVILLRVKKGGLRTASILDGTTLEEKGALTWADEAASTQITMEAIANVLRLAQAARTPTNGSWFAVQSRFLADLKLITQACGKLGAVTVYPPQNSIDPIGFEASGDGVRWTGVVMPVRVEAPGASVADEDADEVDANETGTFESREGNAGDDEESDDDGIIDDEEAARLKAEANGEKPRKRGKRTVKSRQAATT